MMQATKIAIDNDYDEFYSLQIFLGEELPTISIMVCRDLSDSYDSIIFTESLDKLYCIKTNSTELSYQLQGTKLSFSFSSECPHYFYSNHQKQQWIELATNDISRVKAILESIFVVC